MSENLPTYSCKKLLDGYKKHLESVIVAKGFVTKSCKYFSVEKLNRIWQEFLGNVGRSVSFFKLFFRGLIKLDIANAM